MTEDHTENAKLYRSAISSDPLTLRQARIVTISEDESLAGKPFGGKIEAVDKNDREIEKAIEDLNVFYWGSVEQEIFGRTYNIFDCDNFVACPDDNDFFGMIGAIHGIAGHIAITEEDEGFLHIVVLQVCPDWHGRGVGKKLVGRAIEEAKDRGFKKVIVATTNDNIPALYFYQRLGFVFKNIVTGVVVDDPKVPTNGFAGIPVRDEIHLKFELV